MGAVLLLAGCGTVSPSVTPPPAAASGQPSAARTPLPSVELPGDISAADIRPHLLALEEIAQQNGGVRTAGTPGYEASVDYVADQLREFGYQVRTPSFVMATYRELPGSSVQVLDGGPMFETGEDFRAMIYSASGQLTAEIFPLGYPDSPGGAGRQGCAAEDWEGFPEGAIALTPPGPCLRRDEAILAAEAGAAALVVSYPDLGPGQARRPTLIQPGGIEIPVLSATGQLGETLRQAAEAGTRVRIDIRTEIGSATVRNVIAETGGEGPVAMIGAHLDSVHDGPGINDNGSGVAAVLEIARLLAGGDAEGSVRFAFWATEEFGLHGSRSYVLGLSEDEASAIAAYLNLDMLGSTNGVPMVYRDSGAASGSSAISDYLVGWLEAAGIGAEAEDLGGGSDHHFFAEAGIPTGGIFSGATERKSASQAAAYGGEAGEPMDPCYHLACDTAQNVDTERVAIYALAAARAALLIAQGRLLPPG